MSSPEQYTPRNYSELDYIAAAKRTADAILRSNPLTNAVISRGLMRWVGNHVDIDGDKINFLWIGDFLPADTSMGGIPQKGIVMWRDDSAGVAINAGRQAFALYDHDPGGDGLGLRQTIHWDSVDGGDLWSEARNGGQRFPHMLIPMGLSGTHAEKWPATDSATFFPLMEGFAHAVGRHVYARFWTQTSNLTPGEFRVSVGYSGGTIVGTVFSQADNSIDFREETLDVTAARGELIQVKIEGRRTSGSGTVGAAAISFRNFTDMG